jgi:autotransporter-associated beta strand protein
VTLANSASLAHATLYIPYTDIGQGNIVDFAPNIGTFTVAGLSDDSSWMSSPAGFGLEDTGGNPVTLMVGNDNVSSSFGGSMYGSGGLTKIGTGTLTLNGFGEYTGVTTVSAGTLNVISPGGVAFNNGGLWTSGPIVNNAALLFDPGSTIIVGTIGGTGVTTVSASELRATQIISQGGINIVNRGVVKLLSNGGLSTINALNIDATSQLDLTNNHLIINYGSGPDPIASIAALIKNSARAGWQGPGITSSTAAANSSSYGLGYADSADPGNPAGLASGQIEIKYTLLGDANLDGKVNGTDFAILASNFNQAVTSWDQGDFNYDGKVNGTDFAYLASNFNQGASQSATAALDSFAAANGLMADVPEPMCAVMMVMAGFGILGRRRRS